MANESFLSSFSFFFHQLPPVPFPLPPHPGMHLPLVEHRNCIFNRFQLNAFSYRECLRVLFKRGTFVSQSLQGLLKFPKFIIIFQIKILKNFFIKRSRKRMRIGESKKVCMNHRFFFALIFDVSRFFKRQNLHSIPSFFKPKY